MGFTTELAIIAQNSATAAATIVAATVTPDLSDDDIIEFFDRVREHIFESSVMLAGAESVVEVMENPPKKSWGGNKGGGRSSGGSSRGGSKSGGRSNSRPAPSTDIADDPADTELSFGKYNGKTLGYIARKDEGYLEWLAENAQEEALRDAATEVLEAA